MTIAEAAQTADAVNWTGLFLGCLALLGTLATAFAPVISKRIRGHADARDDKSVELTGLKEAADAAMSLVGEARENAAQAVAMVRGSLEIAQNQITSLNQTIDAQREVIGELRTQGASSAAAVTRLEEELARTTAQRDAAVLALDEQRQKLAAIDHTPEGVPS